MFWHMYNWVDMVDTVALSWIVLAVGCAAYVAWDQYAHNPEPVVMKWGFILVTLYTGPLGLVLYVLADKEPAPRQHENFIKPLWKQAVGSTIHCVAGDATGIIAAAVMVSLLGVPMWLDIVIEYAAGFLFGWFIFQSLFMKRIMGGSYRQNLKSTFIPEFISMNGMMAGMAPAMVYLMMVRDMRAMDPLQPLFWLVMSISIAVGFLTAYPFNVWMVRKGMKHGLMTVRAGGSAKHEMSEADHETHVNHTKHFGHQSHAHEESKPHHPKHTHPGAPSTATHPQIGALLFFSLFALAVGYLVPNLLYNTSVSAKDVGSVIMPPGMINDRTMSSKGMNDMRAVLPSEVTEVMPAGMKGSAPLRPRMEEGVKVFDLQLSIVQWHIMQEVTVDAYAFNKQVPGPLIRIKEGDLVKINVTNDLPEETSIHWHGLILDNAMDGAGDITQPPIEPGETFTYSFKAVQSGTYFYHSHTHVDRQQGLGLYGVLIIDPADPADMPGYDVEAIVTLQEWLLRDGLTFPAMQMEGAFPNYFTINGKSYPDTEIIRMKVGQTALVRFVGSHNNFIHPMHIHGGPFEIIAIDGQPLQPSARYRADTINVGPGQRYDVLWTARKPGKWLIHCHIPHHTTNNNEEVDGGGGLMAIIEVEA